MLRLNSNNQIVSLYFYDNKKQTTIVSLSCHSNATVNHLRSTSTYTSYFLLLFFVTKYYKSVVYVDGDSVKSDQTSMLQLVLTQRKLNMHAVSFGMYIALYQWYQCSPRFWFTVKLRCLCSILGAKEGIAWWTIAITSSFGERTPTDSSWKGQTGRSEKTRDKPKPKSKPKRKSESRK